MNTNVVYDQQEDGSFRHYVSFGESPPWDAEEMDIVYCATEEDAHKLKEIIERILTNG